LVAEYFFNPNVDDDIINAQCGPKHVLLAGITDGTLAGHRKSFIYRRSTLLMNELINQLQPFGISMAL
jgi:hypothetical protein